MIAVTFLAFLIPVAVLGLIVWAIVGFTRRGGGEPFTLASATALFARVMLGSDSRPALAQGSA